MIPPFQQDFPGPQQPFVDQKGMLANSGQFFLRSLWNRTGAGGGVPNQVATGLAATGSTQADALQLSVDWNEVVTEGPGSGVILAPLQIGQLQEVYNLGASDLNVYP